MKNKLHGVISSHGHSISPMVSPCEEIFFFRVPTSKYCSRRWFVHIGPVPSGKLRFFRSFSDLPRKRSPQKHFLKIINFLRVYRTPSFEFFVEIKLEIAAVRTKTSIKKYSKWWISEPRFKKGIHVFIKPPKCEMFDKI